MAGTSAKRHTAKYQSINKFQDMNRLKNFEILKKLGKGTFGVVQKAKYIKTGEIVALKQLLNHSAKEGFPITAMREITIMKKLNHTNVLKIQDMIYEEPKTSTSQDVVRERGCFYTVCGYMSSDLVGILSNPHITLKMSEIKCLMIQLLKGIQYIHEQNFLHRDVKTANILIDEHGTLKIADFGLARVYHGTPPTLGQGPGGGERNYTSLVVTRWYRPPEILLGDRKYTTAVDMWGVGCVFGELFTRKPILSGKTDSHQCQIIFQLLGSPTTDWSGSLDLPNKTDLNIGLTCKRVFEDEYGPIINDAQGLDLMSHLLTLNPYKRFNALDALDHPFFTIDPQPTSPSELKFEECHEIDKERFQKMGERPVTKRERPETPKQNVKRQNIIPSEPRIASHSPTITSHPELPSIPIPKPAFHSTKPDTASPKQHSGIFMPKRRKQRPADILTTSRSQDSAIPLPKRQKSERMDFESDLTDFEEDVSEQKLQVLNLESYRVSSASHENT